MKKFAPLFGIIALAAVMTVTAFAGHAEKLVTADLSIVDGDTATTIEIYPGETVQLNLEVASRHRSYPRIYVLPMTVGEDSETGEPVDVAIGERFLTDIQLLPDRHCGHGRDRDRCNTRDRGRGKGRGHDVKSDSGTFTSDDLGVTFDKSGVYQLFVQVWGKRRPLASSNLVTVTVIEKPFTGVVFTAKRTSVATPQQHYDWTILVDGEPRVMSVLPSAYTFDGMFLTASTGVYYRTAEYDVEGGEVSQPVVAYPDIIQGYSLNKVVDNKIMLGVKDTEYTFAPDAKVYRLDAPVGDAGFEIGIADIPLSWNGRYWLLLDSWGRIRYLFISYTEASTQPTAANLKQLGIVKKFNAGVGPIDPATGLSTEYVYFKPAGTSASPNGKFPLVVWLHGSGGGANVWSSLINDTGVTKFADVHQPLFAAGGAYLMAPRSNEDFAEGHAMRWNQLQVGSLLAAVDDFIAKNPEIDADRVYLGGFSIGGGMVWSVIRERPSFFAAAFPTAPPGRFMPDPASEEINTFASLPIWIVHSVEDTTVRVDTDTQVTPAIPWGSRPVMNAIIPLAQAIGTDSRLTLLHPVYFLGRHMEVTAIFNNMISSFGTLYANGLVMSDPWTDRVESTLIDWLNAQSASANAARAQ